jgi:hypothetical protein
LVSCLRGQLGYGAAGVAIHPGDSIRPGVLA